MAFSWGAVKAKSGILVFKPKFFDLLKRNHDFIVFDVIANKHQNAFAGHEPSKEQSG